MNRFTVEWVHALVELGERREYTLHMSPVHHRRDTVHSYQGASFGTGENPHTGEDHAQDEDFVALSYYPGLFTVYGGANTKQTNTQRRLFHMIMMFDSLTQQSASNMRSHQLHPTDVADISLLICAGDQIEMFFKVAFRGVSVVRQTTGENDTVFCCFVPKCFRQEFVTSWGGKETAQ